MFNFNFVKSAQLYATFFNFILLCGEGSLLATLLCFFCFVVNFYIASVIWTNSSVQERKQYTGAAWFEKTFGINIFSE